MARKSRSHKRPERGRGGRQPSLDARTLRAYFIPLAASASLIDAMFCYYVVDHFRRYGCFYIPPLTLLMVLSLSGAAIWIAYLWLRARRAENPRPPQPPTTTTGSDRNR